MAPRKGRVTERSFYPLLIEEIKRRGGSGVSEVTFNSEPDIVFKLLDRDWLLSVKIGESPAILRSAFIQYHRHKDDTGRSHGLLLFLPEIVRQAEPTEEGLLQAMLRAESSLLVDTPSLKTQYRGATSRLLYNLVDEVGPKLEQRVEEAYPLRLVISLLQEHVKDMMGTIALSDPVMLRMITNRKLLSGIGGPAPAHTEEIGRFLAAYIVLSQILFLRLLSSAIRDILPPNLRPVTHHSLRQAFGRVLHINYRPIYEVDVLDAISEDYLRDTFNLIWGLQVERVRHDLPGRIFHELMPTTIRKMLAAFYTRPQAADILAHLTINSSGDTLLDPACGSGTILVSAYRRKSELFQQEGKVGNPHKRFSEEELFGADIMPFAVHLTSANLAAMDPATTIERTQIIQGDSMKLVPGRKYRHGLQLEMFPTAPEGRTTTGQPYKVPLDKVRVVLMNPPFTKVERGIQKYVDMRRFREVCGGEVGLWGHFLVLADQFLDSDGVFGGVIPINVLRGRESQRVRELAFSEWTPLYILKPTLNYGFSEWSEYRDILFIARKGSPPPGHHVKFCLVKKDLRALDEDDVSHIAQRVQALERLRADDLDIESFTIEELRERFVNLMWFCGASDLRHRDILLSFVSKFSARLSTFPKGYFRTGFRPDKNVSSFLFLTRALQPSRTEQAFLVFEEDAPTAICAHSHLGAEYTVEKEALTPSLRTGVGIPTLSIKAKCDYIASRPYRALRRVTRATDFRPPRGFSWERFWRSVGRQLAEVSTNVAVLHRLNPYSPATHLTAFFSGDAFSPSDVFNVVREPTRQRAKAVCVLLNSSIFLSQFFLLKEETTGRYVNIRLYDLEEMRLYPKARQVQALASVFDRFSTQEFPALREQLDENFDLRYEEFWKRQRTGQLPLGLLARRVRPSTVRLEFDQAVCRALGTPVTPRELTRLYAAIVNEMVITRGLQRD